MKQFLKQVSKYKGVLLLLGADLCLLKFCPELGRESLSLTRDHLLQMLSIIPPIFLLLGLMDVWIPKKTMMKYMGKEAGIKGGMVAFILGSFSAGPLYAAFPIASMFIKKGVSLTNVFLFLGAWSVAKMPMMLFELTQLGSRFTLARFLLNALGVILIAFLMEKTTTKENFDDIYERACEEIEKDV